MAFGRIRPHTEKTEETMPISRRELLAGMAAGAAMTPFAGPFLGGSAFAQAEPSYKPEEGATLRVLRWSPFVKAEEESWLANTKKFTDATGVPVKIDKESWEDIRPKAAVAA